MNLRVPVIGLICQLHSRIYSNCVIETIDLIDLQRNTMTYVSGDGSLVEKSPWSLGSLFGFFFGFFHGIGAFFNTLVRPKTNKYGDRYTRDYRPGSGAPRPPSRRIGGLNLGPTVSVPGGCSSCARR